MNIFKLISWFAETVSTFETEVERRERLGTHLYGNDWRAPTHETHHHHYHGSGRREDEESRKRQRIF